MDFNIEGIDGEDDLPEVRSNVQMEDHLAML